MRTEQLVNCLDNSERTRVVQHLTQTSGIPFILDQIVEHMNKSAQKNNDPTLAKEAVTLDDMIEAMRSRGL